LFKAFDSDFTVVPSEIIAHECLAILTTPLLSRFLSIVKRKDDAWADNVIARISAATGTLVPAVWSVTIDAQEAPAVVEAIQSASIGLDILLRDPADRTREMPCVPLMVVRDTEAIEMPETGFGLRKGDSILFAGLSSVISDQQAILRNLKVLNYVLFGQEVASSWIWRKLTGADAGL
jgi:hypothetical protein